MRLTAFVSAISIAMFTTACATDDAIEQLDIASATQALNGTSIGPSGAPLLIPR